MEDKASNEQEIMSFWGEGFNDCLEKLEDVIAEMSDSGEFDQATLEEIKERMANE